MVNEKKSRKLSFDDVESEYEEGTELKENVESNEILDEPAPQPVPVKEEVQTPVSQKLKSSTDIFKDSVADRAAKYYGDDFVQPDGPVIPKVFNLRDEITKLLVVNTDEDMIKTLVKFEGMDSNYFLLSVHPQRIYDAWKLYAEHEGAIPGKFMELVFSILNVPNKRYFHKVSVVELR